MLVGPLCGPFAGQARSHKNGVNFKKLMQYLWERACPAKGCKAAPNLKPYFCS